VKWCCSVLAQSNLQIWVAAARSLPLKVQPQGVLGEFITPHVTVKTEPKMTARLPSRDLNTDEKNAVIKVDQAVLCS